MSNGDKIVLPALVVILMVTLWAARLVWHVGARHIRSDEQDVRYTRLINAMPKQLRSMQVYVRIYITQAVLAVVVSVAAIAAFERSFNVIGFWYLLGLVIWVIGFGIEIIADRQLSKFVSDKRNRGKLMRSGLWRYSRHPNYFGEALQWWGFAVMAFGSSYVLGGLLGALVITILLRYISGVPQAEKRMNSKPGWAKYKNMTSVFVYGHQNNNRQ